jgi:protoporphyrin/coproporphyrin ferrochelatase
MDEIPGLLGRGSSGDPDSGVFAPKCYFAMRYWHPFTEDVLDDMYTDGINTMVIVPLYPQFSISTSGSSLRVLQDIFYRQPDRWSTRGANQFLHTVVPTWYHRRGYIESVARLIVSEIASFSPEQRGSEQGIHVLFSAHGVPKSYIEAGDPYQVRPPALTYMSLAHRTRHRPRACTMPLPPRH